MIRLKSQVLRCVILSERILHRPLPSLKSIVLHTPQVSEHEKFDFFKRYKARDISPAHELNEFLGFPEPVTWEADPLHSPEDGEVMDHLRELEGWG